MSSTARGGVREEDDFYETMECDAVDMVERFSLHMPEEPVLYEPMAGRGALVRLFRKRWPKAYIVANELNAERASLLKDAGADFVFQRDLFSQAGRGILDLFQFDGAFTNPAFKLALPTAELLIPRVPHVCLLQRLGFLASKKRRAFWDRNPADVGLLDERPSFAASIQCADWVTSDAVLAAGWMPVSSKKKPKWKRAACGWAVIQYLDAPRPKTCPECGNPVNVATSDSADYAWYHFYAASQRQHYHLGARERAEQQQLAGVA